MENSQHRTQNCRRKRAMRVRKGVRGTREKPRLSVVKSNKHVYVQLIDDEQAVTLGFTSTLSKDFRETSNNKKSVEAGRQLGVRIAELAKQKNVTTVVFDRGPFKYHGVVAAVADGARGSGLKL